MPGQAGPILPDRPRRPRRPRCNVCFGLSFGDQESVRLNRPSLREVIRGRKKGCQLCFAMTEAIASTIRPPASSAVGAEEGTIPSLRALLINDCVITMAAHPKRALELTLEFDPLHSNIDPKTLHLSEILTRPRDCAYFQTYVMLEIYREPGPPIPWPSIKPAPHVPRKLRPQDRQRLIRGWLEGCVKGHAECRPRDDTEDAENERRRLVPRRLLDLGGNPRNLIKLVDSSGLSGAYATVSHGWTHRSHIPVLDSWNVSGRMKRIRWVDLPPAFQDAVLIAVEQNIRYLWIHALCVVQDDPADRNWHGANMFNIYQFSHLNISLLRSWDIRRSALAERWMSEQRTVPRTQTRIGLSRNGKKYQVYARPASIDAHSIIYYPCRSTRPWVSAGDPGLRGCLRAFADPWFLLALAAAPRTVHLHVSEMIWQCRLESRCECSPAPHDDNPNTSIALPYMSTTMGLRKLPTWRPNSYPLEGVALWQSLIKIFSVTRSSNNNGLSRAQAVACLAQLFQPLIPRDYIGGVFANTRTQLMSELLWWVWREPYSHGSAVKLHTRWSPSWSWLSMEVDSLKSIRWYKPFGRHYPLTFHHRFRFHGVDTQTPAGMEDGHPVHATDWSLRLRGHLLLARVAIQLGPERRSYTLAPANASPNDNYPPPPPSFSPPYISRPATPLSEGGVPAIRHEGHFLPPLVTTGDQDIRIPEFPWERCSVPFRGEFFPDCTDWEEQLANTDPWCHHTHVYLMELGRILYPPPNDSGPLPYAEIGIALTRAPEAGPDAFRRVGSFSALLGPNCPNGFFVEAQVQNITLV